jgi:hypothetical protein
MAAIAAADRAITIGLDRTPYRAPIGAIRALTTFRSDLGTGLRNRGIGSEADRHGNPDHHLSGIPAAPGEALAGKRSLERSG